MKVSVRRYARGVCARCGKPLNDGHYHAEITISLVVNVCHRCNYLTGIGYKALALPTELTLAEFKAMLTNKALAIK